MLLDLSHPIYAPLRHVVRQIVHVENGAAVDCVLVSGEVLSSPEASC